MSEIKPFLKATLFSHGRPSDRAHAAPCNTACVRYALSVNSYSVSQQPWMALMDTEKVDTEKADTKRERKPENISDMVGDLIVSAATVLAQSAATAVVGQAKKIAGKSTAAKKATKAVAERIPKSVKKAATTVAKAVAKKQTAKKSAKKARKAAKRAPPKIVRKAAKKTTRKTSTKKSKKSKR